MSLTSLIDDRELGLRYEHNEWSPLLYKAMTDAGWENPDGVGVFWQHDRIRDEAGNRLVMHQTYAVDIQQRWEFKEAKRA